MVTSQISRVYLGSVYTDGVCESVCVIEEVTF